MDQKQIWWQNIFQRRRTLLSLGAVLIQMLVPMSQAQALQCLGALAGSESTSFMVWT